MAVRVDLGPGHASVTVGSTLNQGADAGSVGFRAGAAEVPVITTFDEARAAGLSLAEIVDPSSDGGKPAALALLGYVPSFIATATPRARLVRANPEGELVVLTAPVEVKDLKVGDRVYVRPKGTTILGVIYQSTDRWLAGRVVSLRYGHGRGLELIPPDGSERLAALPARVWKFRDLKHNVEIPIYRGLSAREAIDSLKKVGGDPEVKAAEMGIDRNILQELLFQSFANLPAEESDTIDINALYIMSLLGDRIRPYLEERLTSTSESIRVAAQTVLECLDDSNRSGELVLSPGDVFLLGSVGLTLDHDSGEGSGNSGSAAPAATHAASGTPAPAAPSSNRGEKASSTQTAHLDLSQVSRRSVRSRQTAPHVTARHHTQAGGHFLAVRRSPASTLARAR